MIETGDRDRKLLTVGVPCYNSQDYMEKCIDSLLADCERRSWNYGQRAKVDPFFAQVWNPLHEPDELREYPKVVSELDVKE